VAAALAPQIVARVSKLLGHLLDVVSSHEHSRCYEGLGMGADRASCRRPRIAVRSARTLPSGESRPVAARVCPPASPARVQQALFRQHSGSQSGRNAEALQDLKWKVLQAGEICRRGSWLIRDPQCFGLPGSSALHRCSHAGHQNTTVPSSRFSMTANGFTTGSGAGNRNPSKTVRVAERRFRNQRSRERSTRQGGTGRCGWWRERRIASQCFGSTKGRQT